MRLRRVVAAGFVLVTLFGLPSGAGASHDPSGEPFEEDFAVASFSTRLAVFTIGARSGPSGENPTGEVRVDEGRLGFATGRVTCLNVTENRATIGVEFSPVIGSGFFFLEDNTGVGQDSFGSVATPAGPQSICPANATSSLEPISSGDLVVHDAPEFPTSKDQCKNGGWRNYGTTFKNEGQCVSFVATGGKKQP